MAYVRRRGNQIAIVHGERDPHTSKVEQRVLFTIYSRPEAQAVIGRSGEADQRRFRALLEDQYPEIRFDWKSIRRAIEADLGHLPESYEYPAARLHQRFKGDLRGFATQIMCADPQSLASAARVVREHAQQLAFLVDVIQWRLHCRNSKENEWSADNQFFWRYALRGRGVPWEIDEMAENLLAKGEYDRAEGALRLLIDCFGEYADAFNGLGMIAEERKRFDEAAAHFTKAIELGRREFPKRIARKSYWSDIRTRPYIRGLRNLASVLNRMERYDEAVAICDRLDTECGDDLAADSTRAAVFLNLGRWEEAAQKALRLQNLFPEESLIAAFALFACGRRAEATETFLHGAINHPCAARVLLEERASKPTSSDEAEDHNTGVELLREMGPFFKRQARASREFFRGLLRHPRLAALQRELEEAKAQRLANRQAGASEGFRRMQQMCTPEFAREEAGKFTTEAAAKWPGRNGTARN